jgi:hypothetical protein
MTNLSKYPQNNINTLITDCALTLAVEDAIAAREAQLALIESVEAGPASTVDPVGVALGTLLVATATMGWFITLAALMGKIA